MEINLKLENFTGPMSLLYHLIEKNKIDIYDIPIAEITDQYLAVIEKAENKDMDTMSGFLLMAATLIEIKSRMLLPKHKENDEEEIDPRDELVAKLIEYKKFKIVTEEFREREEQASFFVFKEADPSIDIFKKQDEINLDVFLDGVTFDDIYKAFCSVMNRRERKTDKIRAGFNSVERDLFTIEDKISYIKDLLIVSPKVKFNDIFKKGARKSEIITTFLALLELIKVTSVSISQNGIFDDIIITKYNGSGINETVRT